MIPYNGHISMMDFSPRANITGISIKGFDNKPSPEDLYCEVVLIDRSNELMRPLLYQFRYDLIRCQKHILDPIEKNAFVLLGEVDSINKKKKEIYLTNYRTVTYKYLVAASGLRQTSYGDIHDEELSTGVIALWEALRVRDNSFPPLTTTYRFDEHTHSLPPVTQQHTACTNHIQKIAKPRAFTKSKAETPPSLSSPEKRVYEVQI